MFNTTLCQPGTALINNIGLAQLTCYQPNFSILPGEMCYCS